MSNRTAIFIDGGYFTKVLDWHDRLKVDYAALSQHLAAGEKLFRTYFYNCMPYKGQFPTEAEEIRYANMQRFIDKLRSLDRYEVRLGKLEYRGNNADGAPIYVQKRVDTMFACDLVLLSARQNIDRAVLITGDSDFVPAIEVAKNAGVEIELVYDPNLMPHKSLLDIADVRHALTREELEKNRRYW